MTVLKKIVSFTTSVFFGVVLATSVSAVLTYEDSGSALQTVANKTGVQQTDLETASGQIIKSFLGVLGLLFFILVVYAGIKWMTARGDEESVTKARDTIFSAVIGLSVVLAAYGITNFVTERILNGSADPNAAITGGEIGDEPLGCCIDWSAGGAFETYGTAGHRITTLGDCQQQGEEQEVDGYSCVGPKIGCWTFQTGVVDINQCRETSEQ